MSAVTVASLHVYPLKSGRGHAVPQAAVDELGIVGDRRFLVVDASGRFLTQRDTPRLALITSACQPDSRITLAAPDQRPISVAMAAPASPVREVSIWQDVVRAVDLGEEAARWLSDVLARPARLVAIGPAFSRPLRRPTANPSDRIAFTDAAPMLVISEESLADLNDRLDFPLPMSRFRPNIVLRGAAAFAEDRWKRIRVGGVVLRAAGGCARCVITTTDQETLARDDEPLRTLAGFRRGPTGEVFFGQNYIHETKQGMMNVGDMVEIVD